MKVVHVVEAVAGGVHTYFKDLSFFFGDHEVNATINTTIIYSGNRKEIDSKKIKEEFSNGVLLIEVSMVRNFSPIKDLKSALELAAALRRLNPDVIHLHSSKAGVLGRFACFLLFKKKKVFYTPHGYSFLRTDISIWNKKTYWIIEKSFQKLFGGETIACGDTEYEIAKKIGKSSLVRNGINIEYVTKKSAEYKNEVLTIGIVGRITFARNPKLFNAIAIKFPDFNFVWIGDGELGHEITAPNIRITGWFLERDHALKELNAIDIYIQTSLWEGLPIAVLEAMAMKKPVIATNIIGNKDVVRHNETGFLFNEIEELDNYFEILKDEKTRKIFGEKALERCRDLFDKNKNFKKLIPLYQR
ncbi:glycosyltransferase [Flavobacterium gawalongense]|uniref:Glycosyltransferase family 4 protein n=1 Tax=Flavobacterium gawalongense TaxID=2594432 RepID=A0A553BWM8_9FLAO|nr:glycosyltransferase [Flavobacterium gawalongense]TRX09714.1 glycosyltransferase family 4 protein [Flavobacterium gawalongense]TRX12595.1 glycosyltransferase family 4 protein [Flavobacterium gawalongense]TRX26837.1 glycosyltransferase family 4 protein [Flavobacterium gawalongense]